MKILYSVSNTPTAQFFLGHPVLFKIVKHVTFNVFRLLEGFTTIWEGSNILNPYSVEVCFNQTCIFVTLEENIK